MLTLTAENYITVKTPTTQLVSELSQGIHNNSRGSSPRRPRVYAIPREDGGVWALEQPHLPNFGRESVARIHRVSSV